MTNIIQTVIFSLGTLNLTIGIVILLSLAANKLFGKRYSAGCRYIVWTLIILRLCIPLTVDTLPEISKLSLPESITIESKEDHIPPVGNTDAINKTDSEISSNNSEQVPEGGILFDEGEALDTPPIMPNGNVQNNVDVSVTVPSDTDALSKSDSVTFNTENILTWMFWCWLTVAAIIFTVRISGYVIYSRRVRKNITPADSEMCELLRRVADEMGLNTGSLPPLYFTDSASSPMLFGFTKPMILLPSLCRYDVELRGILSHELVHYRRKDLWIKLACVCAVSLNWFNPLVYIAAVKASREMELSCDETVLKKYDKDARISYSRSMLRVVEQCCSGHSSLTTQFDPKKSAIVERFAGILDSKKKKRGIIIIAVVLLTCIMSTGIVLWQMEPDPIPSPDSETTGDTDTEDFEESNSENTAEPDKTEPEDIQTEPYIDTSIDTTGMSEPDPTETLPVTVPLEEIFTTVIPYESYVGKWSSCGQNPGYLTIYSVNEEEATFKYILHKGPLVTGTAVARDGKYVFSKDLSPDLEYSFYGYGYDDVIVSGYLLFQNNRIVLQFDYELEGVSTVYGYAKSEVTAQGEILSNKVRSDILRANGWIDYTETGHDFLYLRNCISYYKWLENFTPYSQEYYLGTTVIGRSGDIFAAVSIVYDKDSDEWNIFESFYYHQDGRVLQDEELERFMEDHGKTGTVLPADDADLIEYFSEN